MTNDQESRQEMYLNVGTFSEKNTNSTANLPGYAGNLGILNEVSGRIKIVGGNQQISLTGIGLTQKMLKQNLAALAADTSRKFLAYAAITENYTLKGEVNYSESFFKYKSNQTALNAARNVYHLAQNHLSSLREYGITDASQAILLEAITAFSNSLPTPRMGTTAQSQATKELIVLFKTADAALVKMDAAVEIIRLTDPNFYNGYKTARKIIGKGIGKLAVKGLVTETQNGEPLKGVSVAFTLNGSATDRSKEAVSLPDVVKKTAAKGGFNIRNLAAGTYQVRLTKAGYAEQTLTVSVNDGEMSVVNVQMEKVQ